MAKRRIFTVRWNKSEQRWATEHALMMRKVEAVRLEADRARAHWKTTGELSQLRVYNKNGRIAFERTYGRDPERSKG